MKKVTSTIGWTKGIAFSALALLISMPFSTSSYSRAKSGGKRTHAAERATHAGAVTAPTKKGAQAQPSAPANYEW